MRSWLARYCTARCGYASATAPVGLATAGALAALLQSCTELSELKCVQRTLAPATVRR